MLRVTERRRIPIVSRLTSVCRRHHPFFCSQTFASLTVSVEYAVFFAYSVAQCLTGTVLGFILFRNRIESKHLAGSTVGVEFRNVRDSARIRRVWRRWLAKSRRV